MRDFAGFKDLIKRQRRWRSNWRWLGLVLLSFGLAVLPASRLKAAPASSPAAPIAAIAQQRGEAAIDPAAALSLGRQHFQAGQFQDAIVQWQAAAQAFAGQGDRLQQGLSLSYLSLAYQAQSQWEAAQTAIAASLELLATGDPIFRAQALNTQASLLLQTGQAEAALETWEQAQQSYEQAGDRLGALGSQINQTQALQTLGFYRRSRQQLESVNQQLADLPDSDLKISGLRSLGVTLQVIGDLQASQAVLAQSLAVAQRLQATPELSLIWLSLGKTQVDAGAYNEAFQSFQQAEQTAVSPIDRVQAQLNQLQLYVTQGRSFSASQRQPAKAIATAVYQALRQMPPSRSSLYATVNLAAQMSQSDDLPVSRQQLAELLAIAAAQAAQLGDVQAEAYVLSQWGQLYAQSQQWPEALRLTQQSLAIARQILAPDIAAQSAWRLGRILQQQGKTPEAIAAYNEAVNALQTLRSDLIAVNPDVQFSFRESVEPVYRELVALLLEQPDQPALMRAREVIEALQLAELDNFFREACLDASPQSIDRVDAEATIFYPILLPDRLAVILSRSGKPLLYSAVPIGKIEVESRLRELLAALHPAADLLWRRQLLQQVYDWLIAPVATELVGSKTLVFVPDGLLRNIPMAALLNGDRYLIEDFAVAFSPGLQLMATHSLNQARSSAILGGISQARNGFSALPGVEKEIKQISQLLPATTLLNQQFTSAALADRVQHSRADIVHLATHGQFSSKLEDTFLLSWEGRLNVKELSELLQTRETDSPIELLVLSACDTAAGDDRAALGLAGLAVKSGARSTLATLWPVIDQAAAQVMTQFYDELRQPGMTKAEALRQAQVKILKTTDYTDPFFWSAFVLVGKWL